MSSPIRSRKSPLAKFYEKVDREFKTRVDAKGVTRADHTRTAAANKQAAKAEKQKIAALEQELKALRRAHAPAKELKAKRQELHQLRSGVAKDRVDAGYHGALSVVNKWVGRE